MKQALLIVDVQPSFPVPREILYGIRELGGLLPSVATVERHNESVTPFEAQLGWQPGEADESLVPADRVFVKHGYLLPPAAIEYLQGLQVDRILVCGTQADTCVLAAGFALFDAGLRPTLLKWLTVGSS
jgi:nicotinamidase-related amidase